LLKFRTDAIYVHSPLPLSSFGECTDLPEGNEIYSYGLFYKSSPSVYNTQPALRPHHTQTAQWVNLLLKVL